MTREQRLLARFGSPLYVYDLQRLKTALADLRRSLPQPSTLFYSLKANPHATLVRAVREGGCRAELSSQGELDAAMEAGFLGADCLYTGPGKTAAEVDAALRRGVGMFSVESIEDLRRIDAHAAACDVVVECLLRVNSSWPAGAGGLRMTGKSSQFGMSLDSVDAVMRERLKGTRVIGAHFYTITNARSEDNLVDEFKSSIATAVRLRDEVGLPLRYLDLGGGFGAPYATAGTHPVYTARMRSELELALDGSVPGWRRGEPEIAFESGRYLVGDCGQLLCTVIDVKESQGSTFVVLDAGVNHVGGLSGIGRLLPVAASPVVSDLDPARRREGRTVTLVGPLCTPADVLSRGADLPEVRVGDVVSIPNVGAYGLTASLLAFLSRPVPCEVVLCGDEVVSASRIRLSRATVNEDLRGE